MAKYGCFNVVDRNIEHHVQTNSSWSLLLSMVPGTSSTCEKLKHSPSSWHSTPWQIRSSQFNKMLTKLSVWLNIANNQ
ncbi:hypothetical protein BLA29_006250 [Euroglyphus maynei]|uniref:Uncharacterized protein n=1 Tax=Euroglyphus maynei TaxID=6958 RepID=A0A1Y3B9T6_EURMA|nr:hypothetical protein BLA29_006250 [Euroglyphus maynei]